MSNKTIQVQINSLAVNEDDIINIVDDNGDIISDQYDITFENSTWLVKPKAKQDFNTNHK